MLDRLDRDEPLREDAPLEPPAPPAPLLEARGLCFESGGARLVHHVDLALRPGRASIVMGPNGAGKSLLLRLLHGLIAPSAGAVLWRGAPLCAKGRREQAMVFQKAVLLRRTAAANIDFALKLRGVRDASERDALLDHVGLLDKARQPARLLSGGEQQRLALARALAMRPKALFLDEPTASLDPAATERIEQLALEAKARGVALVFVTHDRGQARRLADEVVFVHRGRIAERTPAARFFDAPASAAAAAYLDGRLVI